MIAEIAEQQLAGPSPIGQEKQSLQQKALTEGALIAAARDRAPSIAAEVRRTTAKTAASMLEQD
jgi:hypothetical protein